MSDVPADTRFAFQPLVNLHTGGVVGVELLARPSRGNIDDLLASAARAGRLEKLDVTLGTAAVFHAAGHDTWLPLHVNLLADTVAADRDVLNPLHRALARTGRDAEKTVLDINPCFTELEPELLLAGLRRLRRRGYRISLDGVGGGSYPLTTITEAGPDLIKMDREIVAGLPERGSCVAILEALVRLAARINAYLVAEGVERPEQLATLRRSGVILAQGNILCPPRSGRPDCLYPDLRVPRPQIAQAPGPYRGPEGRGGPAEGRDPPRIRITDFLRPAPTLPLTSTAEQVRSVFAHRPELTSVVLLDSVGRPEFMVDRNRFLLTVSGAFGHALHARRPAATLADPPRILGTGCGTSAVLTLVRGSDARRMYDDIVVLGADSRYLGVVRVGDVLRFLAETNLTQATAGRPLIQLRGSESVSELITRRLAAADLFTVNRLSVAGELHPGQVIRALNQALTGSATTTTPAHASWVAGHDIVLVCDFQDTIPLGTAVLDTFADPGTVGQGTAGRAAPRTSRATELSLASLACPPAVTRQHDVFALLAQLYRKAAAMPGASWVFGRPHPGTLPTGRRRVDFVPVG